jgi:uncharacterized protein YjdB
MKKKKFTLLTTFLILGTMASQVFAAVNSTNLTSNTNVAIVNNYVGTDDTITIAANTFENNDNVIVTDSKKTLIKSLTISDPTIATEITVKQLAQAKGKISISVTNNNEGATAKVNSIDYKQEKSPVVSSSDVSIVGNADTDDVVTITGLNVGDVAIAYTNALISRPIAKSKAATISTATIKLGATRYNSSTGIYISVIRKGARESDRLLVTGNYTSAPITNTISTTNVIAATNGIMVIGLIEKDIITIYKSNPTGITDKKALKAITLTTTSVSKGNTYGFSAYKAGFPSTIYVTMKKAGKRESAPITGTKGIDAFAFVASAIDPSIGENVTSLSLNKTTDTLTVGDTDTLVATIAPTTATNKDVTWTSSDATIVTIDFTGVITGIKAGTATITATTVDGEKTATCDVTVTSTGENVTSLSLNKTTDTLTVGDIDTLVATIAPTTATNKDVTWTSSDATIVTVDSTGVIAGVKAGTATITVTTVDGEKTATCDVTVTSAGDNVTSLSLNKTTDTLTVGDIDTLVAIIAPTTATNKEVTWTSSDATIVTVDSTGVIAGVKAGTATITATTVDGNKTANCVVTITNNVNVDIQHPKMVNIFIKQKTVNVGEKINIKAIITGDISGVKYVWVTFKNPSNSKSQSVYLNHDTSTNLWIGEYVIQSTDEVGVYNEFFLSLEDKADNKVLEWNLSDKFEKKMTFTITNK